RGLPSAVGHATTSVVALWFGGPSRFTLLHPSSSLAALSFLPARRRRRAGEPVPGPRQLKPKPINDLLRHEVVANIPTNAPVQCFGHDVINPKIHALRYFSKGRERCSFRSFRSFRPFLSGRSNAPAVVGTLCVAYLFRGMGR